MTILFLPHGRRRHYFLDLLPQGRETTGWRIFVVCQEAARASYDELISTDTDIFLPLDLTLQANDQENPATQQLVSACAQASGI